MATVVIAGAWWYDWKHYIRYWKYFLGYPPYSRRSILIMRGLLFIFMVNAIFCLIHYIFIYDWSSFGVIVPIIIAIMMLLMFGIFDGLVGWLVGPPNNADWQNGEIKWRNLIGKESG